MELIKFSLTTSQDELVLSALKRIEGQVWSLSLPVFLLNRCWLRLEEVPLKHLLARLPPDKSKDAPELVFYYELLRNGKDPLIAVQECWLEFGMEEFYRAYRNYWHWQEKGNNDWTFSKYLQLLNRYKTSIDNFQVSIPLIILSRSFSREKHELEWITNNKT